MGACDSKEKKYTNNENGPNMEKSPEKN